MAIANSVAKTNSPKDNSVQTNIENCECHIDDSVQTHDHEFLGSTKLAEEGEDRHNHRFAGVTTQAIPLPDHDHKHALCVNTDFLDHHHEIGAETGGAIPVGNGKHVHLVTGMTTCDDFHFHDFIFTTLIQKPLV